MNLQEFITESLVQIVKGIEKANEQLADSKACVNPPGTYLETRSDKSYGRVSKTDPDEDPIVHSVEFDVAVYASSEEGGKKGIGLHVGAIGLGGINNTSTMDKAESRIRFSIPLLLPS